MTDAENSAFVEYVTHVRNVLAMCRLSGEFHQLFGQLETGYPKKLFNENPNASLDIIKKSDAYFQLTIGLDKWLIGFDVVESKSQKVLTGLEAYDLLTLVESMLGVAKGETQGLAMRGLFNFMMRGRDEIELHASVLPYPLHTWYLRMRAKAVR